MTKPQSSDDQKAMVKAITQVKLSQGDKKDLKEVLEARYANLIRGVRTTQSVAERVNPILKDPGQVRYGTTIPVVLTKPLMKQWGVVVKSRKEEEKRQAAHEVKQEVMEKAFSEALGEENARRAKLHEESQMTRDAVIAKLESDQRERRISIILSDVGGAKDFLSSLPEAGAVTKMLTEEGFKVAKQLTE